MVSSIHTIWSDLLSRWSADKNELLLANLIFHTTMIVSYSKTIEKLPELNMQPASMHEELCQKLEQNFAILISDVDKRKLEMLCLQCTHAEHISKPVVEYCLRVKERLEKDYFITFSEESFVSMFESHVEVLLSRVTRNERSENPLTKSIRMASPVIYEMAISAADEFYQTFGVILDEGEIAFLPCISELMLNLLLICRIFICYARFIIICRNNSKAGFVIIFRDRPVSSDVRRIHCRILHWFLWFLPCLWKV